MAKGTVTRTKPGSSSQESATIAQAAATALNKIVCKILLEIESVIPLPSEEESGSQEKQVSDPYMLFSTKGQEQKLPVGSVSPEDFKRIIGNKKTLRQEKAGELIELFEPTS